METTIPLGFLNFDDVFLQEYRQTLIYDECGIVSVFILRDQGWRAGDEKRVWTSRSLPSLKTTTESRLPHDAFSRAYARYGVWQERAEPDRSVRTAGCLYIRRRQDHDFFMYDVFKSYWVSVKRSAWS